MSDDNSHYSRCGVPLEAVVEEVPLYVGCTEETSPPPGPDLRSRLFFGALVSGGPGDAGDQ